jgi:exonuclease VII large subunit
MTTDYEALLSRIAAIETYLAQKEQEQQLPPRPSEPDLDELSTQLAPLVAEKLAQQLTPISQLEQAIATLTQNCSQQLSNQETHFQQQLQHSNELIAQLENAIATAPNQLASHLSMLEQRYQQKFSQLLLEIDQGNSALEQVETVHAAQPPANPGDNNGQINSLAAVVELPLQPSPSIDAATLGPSYPDSTPITATLQQPTSQEALPLFTSSPSPTETVQPQDVTTDELKTNNSSEATTKQAASTSDTDSIWICLDEAFKYAQLQGYKGKKDAFRMKSKASLKANPAPYAEWKLEFDLERRGSKGQRTNWLRPTEPEHYRRLMGRFSGGTDKA